MIGEAQPTPPLARHHPSSFIKIPPFFLVFHLADDITYATFDTVGRNKGQYRTMELIAKIKQAETDAHQIIEKAKADAVALADKGRQERRRRQEQAELNRRRAIDAAVEKAKAEAQGEIKTLKNQAEQQRKQLRDQVQRKVPAAVTRVVEYLKKG